MGDNWLYFSSFGNFVGFVSFGEVWDKGLSILLSFCGPVGRLLYGLHTLVSGNSVVPSTGCLC